MILHRFFLPPAAVGSARVVFPPEQSHQIRRVLRLGAEERVIVLDGSGTEMVVRLQRVGADVVGTIEERRRNLAEPGVRLTLYQGLLKAAKLELVLQKCTEIGVSGFVPLMTERSVPAEPGPSKQRRFETIVREAAEQSRRGRLPVVSHALPYEAALSAAAGNGPVALLWEEEHTAHLREIARAPSSSAMSLFVGPEGGFSAAEVAAARRLEAQVVTLGRRILRAETASIVGAALLLAQLEELG